MPYEPPPELASLSLEQIAAAIADRRLPPVDQWSPAREGDSQMRIAADGRWYHQGAPVTRPAMVRAFASLLLRDATGQHWMVTPRERLRIAVDDAAFVATDMEMRSDATGRTVLAFRLNTDDIVLAGKDNPLRAAGDPDVPALYLTVRHGTEARLNRSTYEQLIGHALDVAGEGPLAVESQGVGFVLVP